MKRKDFSNLKVEVQKEKESYFEHEDYIAGIAPFLRGINSTMYVNNPWEIKKNSNSFDKIDNVNIPSYKSQIKEYGISPEIKLAFALAEANEYFITNIKKGDDIDFILSNFSLLWPVGMNHFNEIATLRAGRMLWAKIVKNFNPKNPKSLALKINCKTSSLRLNEEDSFNFLTRSTLEAMAAGLGGTQSIDTTTTDMENSSPTELSHTISYRTQQFIQEETYITKTVDPWAGSGFIENRTEEIANKAWKLILEIKELGGFTQAIKKGMLKKHLKKANL